MAKLTLKKAATDVTVYLFAQNSSLTTGAGLTGLAYNTASLTAYYVRPLGSAAAITLATQTVTGAHSDGGFVEVDATNMPGVYRLDLPDAVCATGVPSVVVMLKGAANLAPVLLEIQLTDFDLNTAGVLIGATQGAITWGQQKIVANVAGEGALDIENTNTGGLGGVGIRAEGEFAGQYNAGSQSVTSAGQYNTGAIGVWNYGGSTGQHNTGGSTGQWNDGGSQAVLGFDPALALEDTLTAIKGVGWTNQTLVKIVTDISNISAGSGATPQQIWEYATRVLTAGTNIDLSALATATDLAAVKSVADDILVDTGTTLDGKLNTIDTNVDSILADTGTDGVVVASGQTVATVTNLTNLPTMPANWVTASGLKADAVTEIQSGLALEATSTAIKEKTDNLPDDPADDSDIDAQLAAIKAETAAILVDTGTTLDTKINTIDGIVDDILVDTGTTIPATLTTIDNFIDTEVAAILEDTGTTIPATLATLATSAALATVDANVDAILDDTGTSGVLLSTSALVSIFDDEVIVGTYTFSDLLKIMAAALAGKATGGGTTSVTFRGVDDASNVIVATVDANGNRSAVTLTV